MWKNLKGMTDMNVCMYICIYVKRNREKGKKLLN